MKRIIRNLLIYALAIMIIFLFRGKTEDIDITYKETIKSFNQYQIVVNDFIENPSEDKISKVSQYGGDFTNNYYSLIDHQTAYNKLFNIDPIITDKETVHLKELKSKMEQELDKKYVDTAWKEVFKASDFSVLIDKVKEQGDYKFDTINLKRTSENVYEISIQGTFYAEDIPNILTRYFLIETDKGNFYWKKPNDFSMSLSNREAYITVGKTKYLIKGDIRYSRI